MDEATWLATTSFLEIYKLVEAKSKSRRKERLFSVACCRRFESLLTDPRCLAALDAAERYADHETDMAGLKAARKEAVAASRASRRSKPNPSDWSLAEAVQMAASSARADVLVTAPIRVALATDWMKIRSREEEDSNQVGILRDIFGNPFRSAPFSHSWRTDTATALARQMYESRDFGAMPILADALQDAGCDNEGILSHCRDGNQAHVRGCWVVDLVLGKE